mmetsp:Transcript_13945/g.20091  ORF Transcript_13945/g.20091 Transcript_13945/m.20091 type:complete len:95 (-) Transcript_13945:680-964(-)
MSEEAEKKEEQPKEGDDEEEEEEDLEKLQAEIERMEAEAARISQETEALEKNSGPKPAGGAADKKDVDQAKRDGYVNESKQNVMCVLPFGLEAS